MSKLIQKSIDSLIRMFDDKRGLFSYSTRLAGKEFINDFSHPGGYRYTINTILALQKAEGWIDHPWNTGQLIERYISEHLPNDENIGNRGLLLHILSLAESPVSHRIFQWLNRRLEISQQILQLPIQDLAWVSFGVTSYAWRVKDQKSRDFAKGLLEIMKTEYLNPRTLLPRHNQTLRGRFISFGGIVYFLMALQHYARLFEDSKTAELFKNAVRRVIGLQGPDGEWPWFIDSSSGFIRDWYQIYSVHQDAMAMLFLLPALDMGVAEADLAIRKSYQWLFGNNQLNAVMLQNEPFFIYRSIKRSGYLERPARIARSFFNCSKKFHAPRIASERLVINPECRSYHIAWLIYVWIDRSDFPEFTNSAIPADCTPTFNTIDR